MLRGGFQNGIARQALGIRGPWCSFPVLPARGGGEGVEGGGVGGGDLRPARGAALRARPEARPCRPGRPPLPTIEVVETLHLFVREGAQWRQLRAAAGRASGSTLRRRLDGRGATALLRQVHVALIR